MQFLRPSLITTTSLIIATFSGCECTPVRVCAGVECQAPDPLARVKCDVSRTDNATRDTDCDGLSDAEEFTLVYPPSGTKTDPCTADSDGDGLPDGLELGRVSSVSSSCSFAGDQDPASKTSPVLADTDGDGLRDGEEDLDHDGKVSAGESNPLRRDSDCDGLSDAQERQSIDGCSTDPLVADTDSDGLLDGLESGRGVAQLDPSCSSVPLDAEPASHTNGCQVDSDGDSVADGAEDTNGNGRRDPGELDPLDRSDALGPVAQACATSNFRSVSLHEALPVDVQWATSGTPELSKIIAHGSGEVVGLQLFDATRHWGALTITRAPIGGSSSAEETAFRSTVRGLSGAIVQTFTTWDGFEQSVRATYDQTSTVDLKAELNELAHTLLGNELDGLITGQAGLSGPFKFYAQFVRRTDHRVVITVAIMPASEVLGSRALELADVAFGASLSQIGDGTSAQCEAFTSSPPAAVDFLWVVDNSCSMAGYQNAVGIAGNVMVEALAHAGLDWRAGGVTTGYYVASAQTEYRTFTSQMPVMQQWFTQSSPSWFGTAGTGAEESLSSAQRYVQGLLLPKTSDPAANKVREGADLHVILLGDADDQSPYSMASLNAVFSNYDGAQSRAVVHGLVCPDGQGCGETQSSPRRNLSAIAAAGGVQGDINVAQTGSPQLADTLSAIVNSAVLGTGHRLIRPPIAASLRVAIEAGGTIGPCQVNDVPRSRLHGFDFDAATQRLVFFGDCRPNGPGKRIALSYRAWKDQSPEPGGDPCGHRCGAPSVCNANTTQCDCPTNCGGCPGSMTCDVAACACRVAMP